jgi:hypothetical protein
MNIVDVCCQVLEQREDGCEGRQEGCVLVLEVLEGRGLGLTLLQHDVCDTSVKV